VVLIWLSPLVLFLGLILSGRSALTAGAFGTACAALVAVLAGPARPDAAQIALHFAAGAWIGLPAALVIVAGLAFSLSLESPGRDEASARPEHGALAEACLLRGPFLETSTGFGVGYVVAVSGARRLGLGKAHALALATFSQVLVPWGALGIGTRISADIAGVALAELIWRVALVTAILCAALLPLFWRLARLAGLPPSLPERLEWAGLGALLMALLVAANLVLPIELAAMAALAPVLLLRFLRVHGRAGLDRALLMRLMPYAALVAALALMRLVPAIHDRLASPSFRPFADAAAFAPLLSPALPLLAIALTVAAGRGGARQAGKLMRLTAQRAWRAALLTFLLVGMAWIMVGAGLAGGIGLAVSGLIGSWSAAVVPVAGALGGYFTGSNTGAGAVAMPLAAALVPGAEARLAVIATAVVAGSLMTAVSPLRVTMGQVLTGASTAETGAALRALWPWFALVAGLTTALALLAAGMLA
jgi:lactate permease